ncbi:MAG TPA: thiamine pyrophosphate-requiring protein [Caulobacteraceae bacterium]|jgi:pyruvate dehydrogenase (quinone)|nr:thiamine pyrophosphate-requiring protein [Caulobacteraceae bacterium]
MSHQTTGEFFIDRLHQWGVRTIFGYPGDGINGVLKGLEKEDSEFQFVQARHEEMAAFMACAYAKFSGEMGVCLSTGGPGATHLITGLYDAKLDHMPVLAITGQAPRSVRGAHYQQELNLDRAYSDVAAYVQQGETPEQVGVILDRAIRIAKANNAVTAVIMPNDLSETPYEAPKRAHGYVRSGVGYSKPVVAPQTEDLHRAADVLNAGRKVALLVGAGGFGATDEIIAIADLLQAGAAKALLGKAVLPDDLPWVTGTIGLLGTKPSSDMMENCDTLLMIGTGFPYSEFLPKTGDARAVQIDIDASMLSLRYPVEVNLHGDAAETLRGLIPLIQQKTDTGFRDELADKLQDWWKLLEDRAMVEANPVNPQRITWELSPRLPSNVIVTSDSGSCANWYARDLKIRRGMTCSLSGGLASMGAAVPYAIGAKFAHPDRPVIALVGDGAMQMNNMAELITVSKYWRRWADPRWICCVWNNEDLNQVTWEQRIMEGFPRFVTTQSLPNVPYHRFAELIGLKGIYVDDPERLGAAWDEALSSDTPVVIEVKTDPEVPPLPPHISLEQAKKFVGTLVQGDPDEGGLIKGAMGQVLAAVTGHHE